MVQWVRPTLAILQSIADDMRPADVAEIWASSRELPMASLVKSVDASSWSVAVVDEDGRGLVVIGLVTDTGEEDAGMIWMLGANEALKYKREFFKPARLIIDKMLTIKPVLYNMVHADNIVSINWLGYLGFTIGSPVPYGHGDELFHLFYMGKC